MKNYSQLLKELPSKTVVFAFGRFNPPTIGHELLVKAVRKLAQQRKADHVIYASASQDAKKNPLDVSKKIHYLQVMFPNTNFAPAGGEARTFLEAAKVLNKRYKSIIMIAGSDRVPEFKRLLNAYNGKEFHFDTIEVVSAGERDPDADDATGMSASKMRAIAVKGNYAEFKRGLPSTIRDIDGRRLMNDIRQGMGLDLVKEQLNLVKDELREQYFRGEVFKLDDIVESGDEVYKIVKRGSNHLLLQDQVGNLVSKWIQDVSETEKAYMLQEDLTDKTLKVNTDKIKVARIIATMLGIDNAESMANPEQLVNNALRKARQKALNPEALKIVSKMLTLADEVGIKYDPALKPQKLKETVTFKEFSEDVGQGSATARTAQRQSKMADLQAKQAKEKEDLANRQKKDSEQLRDQLKIHEDKDGVTVDKNSNYNLAKSIMRYSDYKKTIGAVKQEEDKEPNQETQSDMDAEVGDHASATTASMSLMHPHANFDNLDHNLRRRKIKYHLGEETVEQTSDRKVQLKRFKDQASNAKLDPVKESYDDNRTGFTKKKREDDEYHNEPKPKFKPKALLDRPHTVHIDGKPWKRFDNGHQAQAAAKTLRAKGKKANAIAHFKEEADLDEARMTAAMKLQKAFQREQEKSEAARKAGEELLKKPAPQKTNEHIEKVAGGYEVESEHGDKNLGKSKTLAGAKKRLAQVEYFKHVKEEHEEGYCPDEYASGKVEVETPATSTPIDVPEEMTDAEIEKEIDNLTDDDYLEVYDDSELAIVDAETGEHIEDVEDDKALHEVLSRMERMRAKTRMRKTKAKRERAEKMALKRYSDMKTINKRARRLAIKTMKKRLLRGRDASNISVPEKERIERMIEKRSAIISRIATRLAPRIRKLEKNRLSHSKFTTGSTPNVF